MANGFSSAMESLYFSFIISLKSSVLNPPVSAEIGHYLWLYSSFRSSEPDPVSGFVRPTSPVCEVWAVVIASWWRPEWLGSKSYREWTREPLLYFHGFHTPEYKPYARIASKSRSRATHNAVANSFKAFQSLRPPEFKGTADPVEARSWLKECIK